MQTIVLTKGKVAVIDDIDYESVSSFRWYARKNERGNWYAATSMRIDGKRRQVHMHRFIYGADLIQKILVDHVNGDGLDNRRENLRAATHQQNTIHSKKRSGCYTSAFKGVHYSRTHNRWVAKLYSKGRLVMKRRFKTEREAALEYNHKVIEIHGNYAVLNKV